MPNDKIDDFSTWVIIQFYSVLFAVFALIWKGISWYFKDKSEERKDFIKEVVKEAMGISMHDFKEEVKNELHQIRSDLRKNNDHVNSRIDDLFKENKK